MGNLGSSSSNRMANFDYSSSARMMMYGRNNKSSPQLDYNWLVKPIPTMADASSLSNDDRCSTTNSMAWSTDDDDESLLANAPDWILTRVFSHLPVVDRLTVELVCWRWNRLVNDRDSWRRFWVMGNEELKLVKHKKFRTLLARFGYQVRQLEFVNLLSVDWRLTPRDVDRIHPMCDNLLTYILPSCPNVRHLRIDYRVFSACDFPTQPVVAKLRTLHIDQTSARDYYSVWYANTLVQLLDGVLCPLLHYLYLDLLPDIFVPMAIQSSCQFPASLRHLGFGPHVNKADIEPLAKMAADSCPNLHSFSARCCDLKEATARRLMKNLHYLKESCYCTDDRHTVVRFGQWEKLRALSIQSLDQPILKTIAQNCPKLEHLAVEKCYGTVSTDFLVQHRMLESIKSVRLADYTAFQAFLPLLVRGTMEFIYLKFNLAGSELWQLVAANPRLRQLHLNQSMGTSVGEFLCREQARFWGNFPKVEADREPVHVYCRELDLDDEIVVSLRARLPWLLFDTWTSLTFDETPMLLLDKIRYEGFAEIPL